MLNILFLQMKTQINDKMPLVLYKLRYGNQDVFNIIICKVR